MKAMDKALFDAYVKKTVDLVLRDTRLTLTVSQTLFSSHQIDIGTMHLLKTLESRLPDSVGRILDLGCGYGPIGLALGRLLPGSELHLVDRDALALAFARHNADLHEMNTVTVYGSLGYGSVETGDFDLIASNIPGKAGNDVIRSLLNDARHYLAPDGIVAIVVVSPLEPLVLETLTHPDIEILLHEAMAAHSVFHYRFLPSAEDREAPVSALDRGFYDRETLVFLVDDVPLTMQTAHGLPDFDTLSFQSALLVKSLQELQIEHVDQAAVFHPGQGHVPVVLWQLIEPRRLHLVDRDLLSLHYAKLNLLANGCRDEQVIVHHQVPLVPANGEMDLIVGVLREEEGPEALEQSVLQAAAHLAPEGRLLIVGGSTPVTRILKSKEPARQLRTLKRKRHKGNSVALFQRR
jgi:16S rRNA (guanine1207-N2)-methyltransferase